MATQLGNIPLTTGVPLDSEVVHRTENETIGGTKTFTSNIINSRNGNNVAYISRFAGTSRGTTPDKYKVVELRLNDAYDNALTNIIQQWTNQNNRQIILRAKTDNGSDVNFATFTSNGDGSSVSAKGSALAAVGMPSNSVIDNIMPLENGATYIAPLNGYISIIQYSNVEGNSYLRLTGSASIGCADRATIAKTMMHVFIPIAKGATATLYCDNVKTGTYSMMRFIKAQAEV